MRVLLLSSLLLTVSACTWVPIEPAGKATRVLPAGPVPAGCIAKGEVVVTVKSKVGYNRNRCACRKSWKRWPATRPRAQVPMPCRPLRPRPMAASASPRSSAHRAERFTIRPALNS